MNLLPILAASMCAVDLYDSPREPGGETPGAGVSASARQERFERGHTGWQLDIMGMILEYMHDRDVDEPGGFVSRSAIIDEIERCLPYSITEQDIDNVLNSMARRIDIRSDLQGVTERDNQLIQKRRGGAQFSLRPLGRVLIQLSISPEDWFAVDIDAQKIIKSLRHGRFGEAFNYCKRITNTLQDKIFDFQAVLEEPLLEAQKRDLKRNEAQHRETLDGIDKALPEIKKTLEKEQVQERLNVWIEINPEQEFYANDMYRLLAIIDRLRDVLSRIITAIVESISGQGSALASLPNFSMAAKQFVVEERDHKLIDHLLSLNGVATPSNKLISAREFILPAKVNETPPARPQVVPSVEIVEKIQEMQEAFRDQYGFELEAALKTGPLSIREVIEDLGLGSDSIEGLSTLLGVSMDLTSIGIEDPIVVKCDFNQRKMLLDAFHQAEMADLLLISEKGDADVL